MRDSSNAITICEVLRNINDLCQDKTDKDKKIRKLLFEAEIMAKKMARRLLEYNESEFKDYWKENKNKLEKIKLRNSKYYLTGE